MIIALSKSRQAKIKKNTKELSLELIQNPDIVADVAVTHSIPCVVAFAAETCDVVINARSKLTKKGVDMVIANHVGGELGFNSDENEVTAITEQETIAFARTTKRALALKLIKLIAKQLATTLECGKRK